jgi:hypothetical protein
MGFPDWGKVQFYEYPAQDWATLLPNISEPGRDLISKLVRYESSARLTAAEVRALTAQTKTKANLVAGSPASVL